MRMKNVNVKAAHEALLEVCDVLGILYKETEIEIPDEVKVLVEQRADARKNKEWALSDELRDKIAELGFTVEDSREGQKVKRYNY